MRPDRSEGFSRSRQSACGSRMLPDMASEHVDAALEQELHFFGNPVSTTWDHAVKQLDQHTKL